MLIRSMMLFDNQFRDYIINLDVKVGDKMLIYWLGVKVYK